MATTLDAGPLAHIKVLDLSRVLAGPWAGQLLGDYGADVIKVERPGTGDDTRTWGPPYAKQADGSDGPDAAYFLCANRNKRSVTIDFTQAEGQRLVRDLARGSDVVIENFKLGGLAAYGLDYASLSAEQPGLIYCSITGFGQTGPYAPRAGYDFLIQGMGGLMSITGKRDGEPGAGPQKVGVAVTDVLTGLYATTAILAALAHRERTGVGQHIDLALLDVGIASLANQTMNYLQSGVAPQRMGNGHPNVVPYQDFPTADGDVIIAVGNDGQFSRLCQALGRPDLASDPRYVGNTARVAHRDTLIPALAEATRTRTTAEWVGIFETRGVPCGPINTLDQVFADPHVQARGMQHAMDRDGATLQLVANPVRLSESPVTYRRAPPRLGADTDDVLQARLGLSPAALRQLRDDKVI
ncbi:MAG: CaiB/BaiF CoA-transferase family protein [Acetobacteraceae bacterium]|nr:CaiB/BaiF CoA-transferase family protein [Acetobacteraceae bacterium]